MRNYNIYFALMGLCLLGALGVCFEALVEQKPSELLAVLFIQIPMGLGQLLVGVILLSKLHTYPDWVRGGVNRYWQLSIGYLILWALGANLTLPPMLEREWLWLIWLALVPWCIAIYQFSLLYRMAALRKRQLQKRELLQLS